MIARLPYKPFKSTPGALGLSVLPRKQCKIGKSNDIHFSKRASRFTFTVPAGMSPMFAHTQFTTKITLK